MRACSGCGRAIASGRRCAKCERSSPSPPSYGSGHRRRRAVWVPVVASGRVRCARGAACLRADIVSGRRLGGLIRRGEVWNLDHRDDGRGYLGPAHADCNLAAGAAKREERR